MYIYNIIIINIFKFIYWSAWSFIVGGMIIAGIILAPIGFYQLPLIVPDEISSHAYEYASILFTKFFSVYFTLCAYSFILITLLEQWRINNEWHIRRNTVIAKEVMIIAGNILWLYLMIILVPVMQEMVMNPEKWSDHQVRAQFQQMHEHSRWISQSALIITLFLPWLSRSSGFLEQMSTQHKEKEI